MRKTYPCHGRCGLATKVDILLQKLEPNGDDRTEAKNKGRGQRRLGKLGELPQYEPEATPSTHSTDRSNVSASTPNDHCRYFLSTHAVRARSYFFSLPSTYCPSASPTANKVYKAALSDQSPPYSQPRLTAEVATFPARGRRAMNAEYARKVDAMTEYAGF